MSGHPVVTPGAGDEAARAPAERSIGSGLKEHVGVKAIQW